MAKTHIIVKLLISLVICLGGGFLASLVMKPDDLIWYNQLNQPLGAPPNVTFPIVWTVLYTLIAISLTLFWSSFSKDKKLAGYSFALQLLFNFIWTWLFFSLKIPFVALIDLTLLLIFLILTIFLFKKHSRWSAYLLFPYLLWSVYAWYLNFSIWRLN